MGLGVEVTRWRHARLLPLHRRVAADLCCDLPGGGYGEGTILPRTPSGGKITHVLAEENLGAMLTTVSLQVSGKESDLLNLGALAECITNGCGFSGPNFGDWQVPQGVEFASKSYVMTASDIGLNFQSTMYFHIDLFHDNLPYVPNHGSKTVHTTW